MIQVAWKWQMSREGAVECCCRGGEGDRKGREKEEEVSIISVNSSNI
jgi:hypothetical protein